MPVKTVARGIFEEMKLVPFVAVSALVFWASGTLFIGYVYPDIARSEERAVQLTTELAEATGEMTLAVRQLNARMDRFEREMERRDRERRVTSLEDQIRRTDRDIDALDREIARFRAENTPIPALYHEQLQALRTQRDLDARTLAALR